jgi:RNA-binding protein
MSLSKEKMRQYKGKAHHLNPVAMIGQKGLTEEVLSEIDVALNAHELIKIKIANEDRVERADIAKQICEQTGSDLIQTIGRTITIYRKCPE